MIPALEGLKEYPIWVFWKYVTRTRRDGTTYQGKLNLNPFTGKAARTNDPQTWGTYQQAKGGYRRFRGIGLGIALTKEMQITALDLDDIVKNDRIDESSQFIIDTINSYTEYSPSKKGVRILVNGNIERMICRPKIGFEMFDSSHFCSITGQHFPGTPNTIECRPNALQSIYNSYKPPEPKNPYMGCKTGLNNRFAEITERDIQDMLSRIPRQLDYHDWISILMAVHSVFPGQEGIDLVENWSPGYRGEVYQKWRSFRRDGTTIGTLFYFARQHGWEPMRLQNVTPPLSIKQLEQVNKIVKQVRELAYWQGYYDALKKEDRPFWYAVGADDRLIDRLELGIKREGDGFSLTIPCRDVTGQVVNVEYIDDGGEVVYESDLIPPINVINSDTAVSDNNQLVMLPSSLDAIQVYDLLGDEFIISGLPQLSLRNESLDHIAGYQKTLVIEPGSVVYGSQIAPLRGNCSVIRLPIPFTAVQDADMLKGWIGQAERWG